MEAVGAPWALRGLRSQAGSLAYGAPEPRDHRISASDNEKRPRTSWGRSTSASPSQPSCLHVGGAQAVDGGRVVGGD